MHAARLALAVLMTSVLLTVLFWGPLWIGYGFVGGDLYPYFFPQKVFLADRLHAGEFPLWNNLTGFGYPVLGESQTGAAYPPYFLAYLCLSPNTAYNVQHLLHYVVCLTGTWLFARKAGFAPFGALLTAIVFTYGWFPPRACLEWAIVTGAWMPVALWCVESFLQQGRLRFAIGLSVVLGLQLLAGHFHLAFITQLLVISYAVWRRLGRPLKPSGPLPDAVRRSSTERTALVVASVAAGFLLASVQLFPAWELKTRSSRASVGGEHEPSYGHLPPLYLSQLVAPWMWYSPLEIDGNEGVRTVAEFGAPWHWFGPHRNLDELLMQSRAGGLTTVATNRVEAHLYCGLVPLGLALWWLFAGWRKGVPESERFAHRGELLFWGGAGLLAALYATGWLLPVARFIPGFNFFRGPGRYGIVTTITIALFAGRGLDALKLSRRSPLAVMLLGLVFWSTVSDLWLASRMVRYAVMVDRPPISFRDQSPIRKILLGEKQAPRLYAPGQNLGNLLGVSCLPVYLGIAPSEYSAPYFTGAGMPKADESGRPLKADEEFSGWLRGSGVTHVLSFSPLEESSWNAAEVWQGIDPLLNSAWGRPEPLYLYRLNDAPGRASIIASEGKGRAATAVVPFQFEANQVSVLSDSSDASTIQLRDLNYPGWFVDVDGAAKATEPGSAFREVEVAAGDHRVTWRYRPWSVRIGLWISVATLLTLAAIAHVSYWHPRLIEKFLERLFRR